MNTEYKVTVRETSTVTAQDGDVTEMTSLSPGCLRESDGGFTLTYTQTNEGTKIFNRITAKGASVRVVRSGAVSLSLLLEPGRRENTVYAVPPFRFDMTVTTDTVTESDGGCRIGLVFHSVIGGAPQTTRLSIRARTRKENEE